MADDHSENNAAALSRIAREIERSAETILELSNKLALKHKVYLDSDSSIQKGHQQEAEAIAWQIERLVQAIRKNLEEHLGQMEDISSLNLSTFKGEPVFLGLLNSLIKWYDVSKHHQKLTERPFNLPRTLFDKSVVQRAKISRIDAGILQTAQACHIWCEDNRRLNDYRSDCKRLLSARASESFGSFLTAAPGFLSQAAVEKIKKMIK